MITGDSGPEMTPMKFNAEFRGYRCAIRIDDTGLYVSWLPSTPDLAENPRLEKTYLIFRANSAREFAKAHGWESRALEGGRRLLFLRDDGSSVLTERESACARTN